MSGLMNSYLYGKAGKADFTPDQLPANRVALFFEMLRIRFSGLMGINLICLIAALPAIIWSYMSFMVIQQEAVTDVAMAAANLPGRITTYLLGMIPCLIIISVLNTGVCYILRNWARDQHTFTLSDYKDAVKANWKSGLILGLINGLSLLVTYISYTYYGMVATQSGSAFLYVPQMLVVIICALWWMANMLITPMMVTYEMNFRTLVRNSFIMTLSRLPWSLLFWGLSVAIPLVVAWYIPYGVFAVAIIYVLIGFSLTYFIYASYANSCFDRFLNPRIEGAQVNMGLRDPNLVEEDEEVTEEDIKNL